jgi:hypothetical protein
MVNNDDVPVSSFSDAEISDRTAKRKKLCISYPSICAHFFEMVVDIVIEAVIGWDIKKDCSAQEPGLFDRPEAFTLAVEEQGRDSLHMHIQVWVKEYSDMPQKLTVGTYQEQREGKHKLCKMMDEVASTKLFDCKRVPREYFHAFPHACSVNNNQR